MNKTSFLSLLLCVFLGVLFGSGLTPLRAATDPVAQPGSTNAPSTNAPASTKHDANFKNKADGNVSVIVNGKTLFSTDPAKTGTTTVANGVSDPEPEVDKSDDSDDSKDGAGDKVAESAAVFIIVCVLLFCSLPILVPLLIVFIICYFIYRRRNDSRQERMALAREFLLKGAPVPPQLLEEPLAVTSSSRLNPDTRRGIRWSFAGLGIALAFGLCGGWSAAAWGLVPLVIGVGFFVSGWLETRGSQSGSGSPRVP